MATWFSKGSEFGGATETAESADSAEPVGTHQESHEEGSTAIQGELIEADAAESENGSLMLLQQAHHAIAQARSLDEIKGIRDKAEAARKYAQAAGMGLEIQNYAAEVKLRAERRAGHLLAKLKLHGGDRRETTAEQRLTLEEIGVTKDQSSRWQLTALVPEKSFERYVEATKEEHGEVTTAGLVRLAREIRARERNRKKSQVGDEPLSDFEHVESIEPLLSQGRKFACVYADPPWPSSEMPSEDSVNGLEQFLIASSRLAVPELIEPAAHLHLWASNDSLFAAKSLMEAWGFEFKGCLLCLNPEGRPGKFWVEAHEYLLLGVRGDLPLMERSLNSWMRIAREPNGCPSERVRKLIERVSPGPYLELFGRRPASGWTLYSSFIEPSTHDGDLRPEEGGECDGEAACA